MEAATAIFGTDDFDEIFMDDDGMISVPLHVVIC